MTDDKTKGKEAADRPTIEITEEMVEAGFVALKASGIADDLLEADRLVVAEIFEAMASKIPAPCVRLLS